MGKQRPVLEDHPHIAVLRPDVNIRSVQRPAADGDSTGIGGFQTGDHPQQGGFAASGGTQQGQSAAARDAQGDRGGHGQGPEGFSHVVQADMKAVGHIA